MISVEALAVVEQLRDARTDAGMTQQDLAVKLGISKQRVGGMECGYGNVGLSTVVRWAQALGVTHLEIP